MLKEVFRITPRRVLAITAISGTLLDVAVFLFTVRPNGDAQLSSMLTLAVVLGLVPVNLVLAVIWRKQGLQAAFPLLMAIASLVLTYPSIRMGGAVRAHQYQARLPQYREVIGLMELGEIPVEPRLAPVVLPERYSSLAVRTLAEKDSSGTLTVEFLIGGGFPVKHEGYLFRSRGTLADWEHARRWPNNRKLAEHWYEISD